MNVIQKFTAIKVTEKHDHDNEVSYPKLSYGRIDGPYYSREYPATEFDTEEEAINHAYKTDKYGEWLILPLIRFNNYDE